MVGVAVGVAVAVGVGLPVPVAVAVGVGFPVAVAVAVGVGEAVDTFIEKDREQFGLSSAFGKLDGTFGATDSWRNW
jgi:hypothetical protein